MPDITFIIRPTSAARILTDAVNDAHTAGLTVSTAPDLGVVCVSTVKPHWQVDPRASGISVLGAVLLARQPPIADATAALVSIFQSRAEYHKGIEDGVAGKLDVARDDRVYSDGVFLGVQLRTLVATVPCVLHLIRYPRGEKCPRCAAGVPVERPADEPTNPVQFDTPRSVVTAVLAEMTDPEELETLADRCRARVPNLPPALAEDLRVVEFTLRALATDLRKAAQ